MEARGYREAHSAFTSANATILGISPDSPETLAKYKAEKHAPFEFVSDQSRTIAPQFGITGKRFKRITFVIAKGGKIAASMHHEIRIGQHIKKSLETVQGL